MSEIHFSKYHGAGNDFIMIDHINGPKRCELDNHELFASMCARHFGIGADGLIILEAHDSGDYYMRYFNADGHPGSFCGNGSRCCFQFARDHKVVKDKAVFWSSDGPHSAFIQDEIIYIKMEIKAGIEVHDDHYTLDTGSPHYIKFVQDIQLVDVFKEGSAIRNSEPYRKEGINVNFVQSEPDHIYVKTFERGVEDITLACGTGVTAAAIADAYRRDKQGLIHRKIISPGGELSVQLKYENQKMDDIWLGGPAVKVFDGVWMD